MAIYHLTAKTGTRSGGQSARAKAHYILREGKYARDRDEVAHARSGHMPGWAQGNPVAYWEAADTHERANGRLFKELEFALPVELAPELRRELAEGFARHLTEPERLPYTLALHEGKGENPHCHLMISERVNDGLERTPEQWFKRHNGKAPELGGARKTEALKPKAWLEATREAWADYANQALERAGHEIRIDHRTLEAQGVERVAQIHLGPNVVEMEARGVRTERADQALTVDADNGHIIELQAYREAIEHERDRAGEELQRDQRAGGADRAAGAEHGHAGGRRQAEHGGDESGQRGPGRELVDPAAGGDERLAAGRGGHEEGGGGAVGRGADGQKRRWRLDMEALGRGLDRFRDTYSGAADRILALAGAAGGDAGGRGMAAAETQLKGDRTVQAMVRQLKAMGCERYEVGVRDGASGKMLNREWGPGEVIQNAAWLKRMNAQGNDIYIRPAREVRHGLVLVDDLSADDLDAMQRDGREPALVVETSPKSYQAWVKVPETASDVCRGEIARQLAVEYEADPNSADSRHYGRLAGFTNRKDKHTTRTGHQPWVLCRESGGRSASAGAELAHQAEQRLQERARRLERSRRLEGIEQGPQSRYHDVKDEYLSEMKGLLKRYGDDLSRCDFIAAMKLASKGRDPERIAQAMAEASPGLMERKAGHEADYIQRTIDKVMTTPEVVAARAELARKEAEQGHWRGPSR